MKPKAIKYPYYQLIVILCFGLPAKAQKLPNVQAAGLYAPADVKIDGKATEWNNKFQAYNKSTSVFYTMANSNDNLILVVQATDKTAIGKILGGGITLTITDKNKANTVSITTPVTSSPGRANIAKAVGSPGPISDSLLSVLNKSLVTNFKEIRLKGIVEIPDSTISIYNEYGIKVSGLLDANKAYSCEMAIPLKYLKPQIVGDGSFNYNITINGVKFGITGMQIDGQPVDQASPAVLAVMANIKLDGSPMMELTSQTDFSGTYTLVKN